MNLWQRIKNLLSAKSCKYIFCVLLPILLLPLAINPDKELRCTYVIVIVALYWLLEPVAVAATALLPIVLFPLLGVLSSADVCNNYMTETFMMFIGGLIVAIAVENCNLHERIALKVLLIVGSEPIWLMLGFMLTTMFLSMWVSNTATTGMMVPIVEAVVMEMSVKVTSNEDNLPLGDLNDSSLTESKVNIRKENTVEITEEENAPSTTVKTALLLSICYSANIGGTGTLTGTGPNLVLKGILEENHPESEEITFATWMMYNVPGMVLCVLVAWIYLYVIYIRCSKVNEKMESKDNIRKIIRRRYENLGKISFQEVTVIVFFVCLVILWVFRQPKFVTGWADIIGSDKKVGDAVPAIAIAFLFFIFPSNPKQLTSGPPLLDWKTAQSKLPWGVIILVGGGFALANGAKASGLSCTLGKKLATLDALPPGAIAAVMCFSTAILTEVVTNTTMATILLPVISQMAVSAGVNPLFLMLPVAVTCSFAFMLPVATPPNAIAFDSGHMKALDMVKPGFAMNIICCCVELFMINTLGVAMFNLNTFPDWANQTMNSGNVTDICGDLTKVT